MQKVYTGSYDIEIFFFGTRLKRGCLFLQLKFRTRDSNAERKTVCYDVCRGKSKVIVICSIFKFAFTLPPPVPRFLVIRGFGVAPLIRERLVTG